MAFIGHTDQADQFSLRGSIACDTFPSITPFVDIVVNRRLVARLPARNFSFNPFEALSPGLNFVELFVAGSDQLLEDGTHRISGDLSKDQPAARESDAPVDTFLDEVQLLAEPELAGEVLALGPKLAKAVRERGQDCEQAPAQAADFDLALAANSCETWFPSIAKELDRIYRSLRPGGMACLDFPCEDPGLTVARAVYESGGAAFYRVYSESELRTFFLQAGFEIMDIVICENNRAIVASRKPEETV